MLVTLVEAWERKHYPLDLPDPVEAIIYHMDQNGLQPRDLIPFIGSRNRVHEGLKRRRPLTLEMIRRLHAGLGIPAESLIKLGRPGGLTKRRRLDTRRRYTHRANRSMRPRSLPTTHTGAIGRYPLTAPDCTEALRRPAKYPPAERGLGVWHASAKRTFQFNGFC